MLEKDPALRIGTKDGIREILKHPWFKDIDSTQLLKMKIDAPYKPTLSKDALDVQNFDKQFTDEEAIVSVIKPQQ